MLEKRIVNSLCQNVLSILDIKYPIICGGMTIISNHKLAMAINAAGGLGIIATGAMKKSDLFDEIDRTEHKRHNIGINIVDMHPEIDDIICEIKNVKIVFIAGTRVKKEWIEILHKKNILCGAFASSYSIATRLEKINIDLIVVEGQEAGGHINAVSTGVLLQEITDRISTPIIAAGGIGTGKGMLGYLSMGASACQFGTKFACSIESIAHEKFKDTLIKARSRDTFVSQAIYDDFSVIPVRIIKNEACDQFKQLQQTLKEQVNQKTLTKFEAQMQIELFWAGSLKSAVIDGDISNGSIMSGQIAGIIHRKDQTVNDIIQELMNDLYHHIRRVYSIDNKTV